MASTFSSLKIELIGTGEQDGTWSTTTNTNLGTTIEQAITGSGDVTFAGTDITLTLVNSNASQTARNLRLVCVGVSNGPRQLIVPSIEKQYIVKNELADTVTIRTASGTGIAIPSGKSITVFNNATDVVEANTYAANLTANTLTYGGVTLPSSVSGTGSMVLASSPALTGTPTAPTAAPGTSTTQIATTAFVVANGTPTGSLLMWSTSSAPTGYLLCDGTAVSRTTYAALFAIVGTTFGAGNTTTTFNLPNYTNRMPYGTTVGATGGSANAIVVSHDHSLSGSTASAGSHQHYNVTNGVYGNEGGLNSTNYIGRRSAWNSDFSYDFGTSDTEANIGLTNNAGTHSHSLSGTTATTGSSGTNANLPPYLGINFIIKT